MKREQMDSDMKIHDLSSYYIQGYWMKHCCWQMLLFFYTLCNAWSKGKKQ